MLVFLQHETALALNIVLTSALKQEYRFEEM